MQFLYFLEDIRVPILNEFMLLVTQLGEETAFLAVALVLFWCVDKYKGYFILSVGFIGTLSNQFMKLWFRIPRPWLVDPHFTILEQAMEAASGYSFPSGHTQSAVGTFGGIAATSKNRWVRFLAITAAVFVPISRMYIGVHTPLDIFVSVAVALLLITVLRPIILENGKKALPVIFLMMIVLGVGFLCFVELYPFPSDIDIHNLESGCKNAYTLLGSLAGLIIVYIIDEKWLHFPTKGVWWAQVLKVAGGLAVVLAVKSGLKLPLNLLFGESLGRSVRYGMIVIVAGILWPLTFKFFNRLGTGEK